MTNTELKQRAFRVLFCTQLFQSLSHFGLKALIILYFVHVLNWTDAHAYLVFGAYMSLLCIVPVLGGYLADNWLGYKHAIIFGGAIICMGHLCMTFGSQSQLFLGLSCITLGSGLMLPALCTLVGLLFEDDVQARDKAFNWYYMAVNVGGVGAGVLVGSVAHWFGWHAGFGLAAIGMFSALLLISARWPVIEECLNDPVRLKLAPTSMIAIALGVIGSVCWCFYHLSVVKWLVAAIAVGCAMQIGWLYQRSMRDARVGLGILTGVFVLSIAYLVLYELSGTSIVLFTERMIDRHVFGWSVPTPVLQALNPFYIILLAPLMSAFWRWLKQMNIEPSTLSKIGFGISISSAGFLVLALVSQLSHPSLWWLLLVLFVLTFSELFVGPVSLSAISEYAPKSYASTLMGVWFLMGSIASYLSAMLARLTSTQEHGPDAYYHVFHSVGVDGLLLGLVVVTFMTLWHRLRA